MKMDLLKLRNGLQTQNTLEIGETTKRMDSAYNFMEMEINMR